MIDRPSNQFDWKQIVAVSLVVILAIIGFNSFVVINPGEAGVVAC